MSEVAEVVAENVEEAVDGVVDILEVTKTNPVVVGVAVGFGVLIGAAGGYFVAKQKLKSFYEDLATEEIAQAKEFYAALNKVDVESGDVLSPMEVLDRTNPEAAEALRNYQGENEEELIEKAKDEQGGPWDEAMDEAQIAKIEGRLHGGTIEAGAEEKTVNVFVDPQFDLEEESKYRTEDKPYIITHDEYFSAERDYDNISYTYFEVDDTLVDEQDKPVEDVDGLIGEEHLARFGHGSKDNNIVYVRNDKIQSDFEIIRSRGSYLEEVLGMPEEPNSLKHSDARDRRREFRRGE